MSLVNQSICVSYGFTNNRCNKRVYFAERQVKDGKDYHGICLRELLKGDKPKLIG